MIIALCAHDESPVASEPLHHLVELLEINEDHCIHNMSEKLLRFLCKSILIDITTP
jgi:hypothetical protein